MEKSNGMEWAVKVMKVGDEISNEDGPEHKDSVGFRHSGDYKYRCALTSSWEEAGNELDIMFSLQGLSGFGKVHEFFKAIDALAVARALSPSTS